MDVEDLVREAWWVAHGGEHIVSRGPLGNIVAMWIEQRLGKTDEALEIARWARQHAEAASSLIILCEWSEIRHPESLALRAREVLAATRYSPDAVNRAAAELKRRMGRT